GYDFDSTMLRIGSMNMLLHGVENPDIRYRDSLAEADDDDAEKYSLILANPPFAGSLDYESTAKDLQQIAKTKKTETFRKRMPNAMRRLANRNAMLAKLVDGEVKCIDVLDFDKPRTADMKGVLDSCGVNRTCLVALSGENRNAALSARNLEHVDIIRIDQLNVFEMLNHRFLLVDRASLQAWLDQFAGDKEAA
ncbi:MAG: 50S ribosomal protein L4, partial [Phycisphaerales bacterium]|nr:50S ribosomal protein L4 [Phycisphaerales bacterium]